MKKLSLIIITVFCCILYSCNKDCQEISLSQRTQDVPSDTSLIKKSVIISTEEKQKLLTCIEVAKYSFKFWYEQGIRN